MKNGLSGMRAFCDRTQSMAWSARSSVRWYPSSGVFSGSTGDSALVQGRVPLVVLPADEAVEVLEPAPA